MTSTPATAREARTFKSWLDRAQSLVTILGICAGGAWALHLYWIQRQAHPHARLEATVTRVALTPAVTMLDVELQIENTGETLMTVSQATAWAQQILPLRGCAATGVCAVKELNYALANVSRVNDQFDWPIVSRRDSQRSPALLIEPGERETLSFAFALPADIQTVRIYGFIPNDEELRKGHREIGWHAELVADLRGAPAQPGRAP